MNAALSALDCNFLDAQRVFMGFSDTGEYVERRGVAIASCGLRVRELNFGFLKPPYDDVAATAASVRAYFAERALPFRIAYRSADRERCATALEAAGWRSRSDPVPGMTLPLPAPPPAPPRGLAIERVRTPEEISDWMVVRDRALYGGFTIIVVRRRLSEEQRREFDASVDFVTPSSARTFE